ncbi:MAG: hypothetical protein JXA54_05405 [Candidatus Heimdallarchaeota archaeon]|nr:hypothetical protein [Candidatus Heimdallarchaeota archaeon]
MVNLTIKKEDFWLFKGFSLIPRLITGFLLAIVGIIFQIILPIGGIFPFEQTKVSIGSFLIGLLCIIAAAFLLYPKRMELSEEPKLSEEKPIWVDSKMKVLSDYFNLLNNRERKQKKIAAMFDLKKSKGRWIFITILFGVGFLYILFLAVANRLFLSTSLFLVDFYILILPLWFVIRIDYWEPEILRKILFYYQFTQQEELEEIEFITTPAIQLQQLVESGVKGEVMLPINVRFMIDFADQPASFESLSAQIVINESMGNKFPSFVCFLRMKKPKNWQPLKKDIAYADRIIKIQHIIEEKNLHLFVLSKSPKVEDPNHTSPKEASKIFRRAYKMMIDFGDESESKKKMDVLSDE